MKWMGGGAVGGPILVQRPALFTRVATCPLPPAIPMSQAKAPKGVKIGQRLELPCGGREGGGKVEGREGRGQSTSKESRASSGRFLSNQGRRPCPCPRPRAVPWPPPALSQPMGPGRGRLCVGGWVRRRGV